MAIKTFVHRIARHIAGHAASLRRLDGIIHRRNRGKLKLIAACRSWNIWLY
ncbi:hypothetical protein ACLK11_17915 [Escherichia coli]